MTLVVTLSLLGKFSLILLTAILLDAMLRRRWILHTAALWNVSLLAVVSLPLAMLLVPAWVWPILPPTEDRSPAVAVETTRSAAPRPLQVVEVRTAGIHSKSEYEQPASGLDLFPEKAKPEHSAALPAVLVIPSPQAPQSVPANFAIDWLPTMLWSVYLIGVGIALARLFACWRAAVNLRLAATPMTHGVWLERMRACQVQIGLESSASSKRFFAAIRPPVRLLQSEQVEVPLAMGLFARAVIIPRKMITGSTRTVIDSVLLHELAHIARGDYAWQLLDRVVGAVLWFHPLMWIARRRMAFIRERACDEFVVHAIQDVAVYSEMLLNLAAGLTLRRTLALGVAVLRSNNLVRRLEALEYSRGSKRCNAPLAVRSALAASALVASLLLASIAMGRAAADEPKKSGASAAPPASAEPGQDNPKAEQKAQAAQAIVGTVIDERGIPASGIQVRLLASPDESGPITSDEQGAFKISVDEPRKFAQVILAYDSSGRRQGVLSFEPKEADSPLRVTVKPASQIIVRVRDAVGAPVQGARIALIDDSVRPLAKAQTSGDGMATVLYPADGKIAKVFAFKPGVGCNYFTTLPTKQGWQRVALPAEIALKLAAPQTVKVKAVDSSNRPVAGVTVIPWYFSFKDKTEDVNLSGWDEVNAVTDATGTATFDWLPIEFDRSIPFVTHSAAYSAVTLPSIKPGSAAVETMQLLRKSKLSGCVLLPDGTPAVGIVVEASGEGSAHHEGRGSVRTAADGTYEMLVNSEEAYLVTVNDHRWAAPSHAGVVLREDKPVENLDFKLDGGTVVRGIVTMGPEKRPAAEQWVSLFALGGKMPEELRKPGDTYSHEVRHPRGMMTDANGTFKFLVGPGNYQLQGPSQTTPAKFTIDKQREVVHEFEMPRPERGRLAGKVVDGENRPVAGAVVTGVQLRSTGWIDVDTVATAEGTFEVDRALVPTLLHARTADGAPAGVVRIDADQPEVTIAIGPLADVRGRLLNHEGSVVAGGTLTYYVRVHDGEGENTPFRKCFGGSATPDAEGRYVLTGLLPGEEYQVNYDRPVKPWEGMIAQASKRPVEQISFHLMKLKAPAAGTSDLGETRLPMPFELARLKQTFKKSAGLEQRIDQARIGVMDQFLRILLIVCESKSPAATELMDARFLEEKEFGKAIADFEQLFVAADDAEAMAVLRDTYGLDESKLTLPAFVVLGDDGKVLAVKNSLLASKDGQRLAAETQFLTQHALPRPDAEALLAAALDRARRENKRVLLEETGTYCGWCRVLARFIDKHKAIIDPNFIFLKIDPWRFANGKAVMARYRKKNEGGIPWCVILDSGGKALADWDVASKNIGFPSDEKGIHHFIRVVSATAPRISAEQLAVLRQDLEASAKARAAADAPVSPVIAPAPGK